MCIRDRALDTLNAGWPLSYQSCECLQAQLAMLGRLERHAAAKKVIRSLEHSAFSQRRELLDTMLKVAASYPDPAVRREIEPVGIAIAGHELSRDSCPDYEKQQVLLRLPKFASADPVSY